MTHSEYNRILKEVRNKGRKDFAIELGLLIRSYHKPLTSYSIDVLLEDICDKIKENIKR